MGFDDVGIFRHPAESCFDVNVAGTGIAP